MDKEEVMTAEKDGHRKLCSWLQLVQIWVTQFLTLQKENSLSVPLSAFTEEQWGCDRGQGEATWSLETPSVCAGSLHLQRDCTLSLILSPRDGIPSGQHILPHWHQSLWAPG